MFDLIITGGRIVNGTGSPWFRADVGVKDEKIAVIGDLRQEDAARRIDVDGSFVAPGFIDIHSHSDYNLLLNPEAESKIRQGVTTEVIGQCGNSAAPVLEERLEQVKEEFPEEQTEGLYWETMAEYLSLLSDRGMAVNCAALVGHGNIRRHAMGERDREPDSDEMQKMLDILEESLEAGAFGMSTGLIYPPGVYSETDEIIELAKMLGRYGGVYFTHLRNEAENHAEALAEAIEIGKKGGCQVQISHLKVVGESNWGKSEDALEIIEAARDEGLIINADQYPYIATSTGIAVVLPAWAHDGGRDEMLARLKDEKMREKMKEHMQGEIWDRLMVSRVASEENRHYEGMSVEDIAADMGVDPEDAVFDLLLQEEANVGSVRFAMDEDDVKNIMKNPLVTIGSDGSSLSPEGPFGRGKPHPRSYGTFPRVLGKYAREEGIFTMEEAVAKMTSRPAAILGIWDRGLLLPSCHADIVVFDPDEVRDAATFGDPHQFASGIEYVLVNGSVVIDGDEQTSQLPGQVLRKK